ncbi:perforin-1-like [Ambystoma mexicanum]|uniref:perforin-1-like n=1 Tax=Ambystoma mexicanum TaxID=8296 RepID=UPI0037E71181
MDLHGLLMPKSSLTRTLFSFLLLLYPYNVCANCRKGTAGECKKLGFIPGHNLVGEGIDIATLRRKGAYLVATNRWKNKDGTCTLCTNALLEGKLQKLPLSVVDWRVQSKCTRQLSSSVIHSSFQVIESAASQVQNDWKVGLDINVNPALSTKAVMAGSHSKLASFAADKSKADRYSFTSHEFSCTYYRFRTRDRPPLTNQFYQAVKGLPATYDRNTWANYRQVVDTYGTHYITELFLGGKIRDVTAIKSCESSLDGVSVDEVKDCLNLEASANVAGKGNAEAEISACEELKKNRHFKGSFHETYNERESEGVGGHLTADLLFSDMQDPGPFNVWIESLKEHPGILSYSLRPIHELVRSQGPHKENLRMAIRDYVLEKTLYKNCSNTCPPGSSPSKRDSCTCSCPGGHGINSMCCSTSRGLAKLTVQIQHANGLWGDHFTRTDAFVKLSFEGREMRTNTVWNNDNPSWGIHFDFGMVNLHEASILLVEVWDEDNRYDDDRLGSCEKRLVSGSHNDICYLNHGSLNFMFSVVCGPALGGQKCLDYVPSPI